MKWLRVCTLAALVAGCSMFTAPPLVLTGEALKAVGTQFVATSTAITKACVEKRFTVTQCDSFRTFQQKFKLAWSPAVTVQETAMNFGDKTMDENARAIVTGLASELSAFTALLAGGK